MPLAEAYRKQVALLIKIVPLVATEPAFALKGGTAINLFLRDMPRVSVDIDLTYVPIKNRGSIQELFLIQESVEIANGKQGPTTLLSRVFQHLNLGAESLEPFVEANAAGEFLNYSSRTIKQMAREGRIPAHPFGSGARKRWYFLISELAEHLRGQVNSAHGEAGRDKTQRRVI